MGCVTPAHQEAGVPQCHGQQVRRGARERQIVDVFGPAETPEPGDRDPDGAGGEGDEGNGMPAGIDQAAEPAAAHCRIEARARRRQ
jgi:hypothetical protein